MNKEITSYLPVNKKYTFSAHTIRLQSNVNAKSRFSMSLGLFQMSRYCRAELNSRI